MKTYIVVYDDGENSGLIGAFTNYDSAANYMKKNIQHDIDAFGDSDGFDYSQWYYIKECPIAPVLYWRKK